MTGELGFACTRGVGSVNAQAANLEEEFRRPSDENKVAVLYMGGDEKAVSVLMQLLRDKPTSFTPGFGTLRYEIWQFDGNFTGWARNKHTQVLHRIGTQVSEIRQWTWLWEPKLGFIDVKDQPVEIQYTVPSKPDPAKLKGLYPY